MAEIPTDPRELARAILSGKISLEEVAREQARRRLQNSGSAAPSAPPSVKGLKVNGPSGGMAVPTAKDNQYKPPEMPKRVIRTTPPRPVLKKMPPLQRRPLERAEPASRPPSAYSRPAPNGTPPAPAAPTLPARAVPPISSAPVVPKVSPNAAAPAQASAFKARELLRDPATLRRAFILKEILSAPLALRDDPLW